MEKELLNRIILFLSKENMPICSAILYHEFKGENFNAEIIANELSRLNLIDIGYDSSGVTYSLKLPVKKEIKHLPNKFHNDPYGYYLELEMKSTDLSNERLFLEMESLRNEFKDYRQTKRIARISLAVAIIVAIIEIIKLLLSK